MGLLKRIAALALPFALAGCFLTPGKFAASVDVRKDGSITVAYKGELIFAGPDDMFGGRPPRPWDDRMAVCPDGLDPYVDDSAAEVTVAPTDDQAAPPKPCSARQLAELRKSYESEAKARADKKAAESRQFATLLGFGGDDEGNRRLAERLMKEKGWKSVVYRGKGVFEVDYQITSRLDHDFVFPVMPGQEIIVPFIVLRPRADGSVTLSAPAMTGGAYRAKAMSRNMPMGAPASSAAAGQERIDGVLTLTTDGEVLTNNTLDGPVRNAAGRTLSWQVVPDSDRVPEALIGRN